MLTIMNFLVCSINKRFCNIIDLAFYGLVLSLTRLYPMTSITKIKLYNKSNECSVIIIETLLEYRFNIDIDLFVLFKTKSFMVRLAFL